MNPFELFPQAVRHGRLSPGYLVNSKTGEKPSWGAIPVDVIIDNTYTLSEVAPFGQDGDILVYLRPTVNVFHITPDEIAGGSITVDDNPDGLTESNTPLEGERWGTGGAIIDSLCRFHWVRNGKVNVTGGRYHIMSVAYARDQDTGHVIDYELTCKPEGAGE